MSIPVNKTTADFTFKHTGQVDALGPVTGVLVTIQGYFDQRGIDVMTWQNEFKTGLKASDAAADLGATQLTNYGSVTLKIQSQLQSLDTYIETMNSAEVTLTNKTLTTPIIASLYQDAGKTKLMTVPNTASDTLVALAATQTLTNKRITSRVGSVASTATLTIDGDSYDAYNVTAQEEGLTIDTPSGTPTNMQKILLTIKDNGTTRALTHSGYTALKGITLPATTTVSKMHILGLMYLINAWFCVAVDVVA